MITWGVIWASGICICVFDLIGTGRNGSFAFLADWIRMDDISVSISTGFRVQTVIRE